MKLFDFTMLFQLDETVGSYILAGQLGSKAYGTNTPESDDDYTAVAIAPLSHYTGLKNWENDGTLKIEKKDTDNAELTAFDLRKFLKLCMGFNPNVIPLLYLREQDYIEGLGRPGDIGTLLIQHRDAFTSKRAYDTMIGYAKGQRNAVINGDTGKLGLKRKELVKVYGYDVKYASHTVRLLRMSIEFFRDGIFKVYRDQDRDELMEIRQGKWTLGKWLGEVDYLLEQAIKAEKESNLPEKPNFELINSLSMFFIKNYAPYDYNVECLL
jgi:uncharacterized protein